MPSESRITAATSPGRSCFAAADSARSNDVALPVGDKAGRSCGTVEHFGRSAKAIGSRRKSSFSFSHHFSSLPRAWLNRVMPEASSAMLIDEDVSSRKTSAGFSATRSGS